MARKSKKEINLSTNTCKWKVGLYLRLSADDGEKYESDSITNQREFIYQYLNQEENIFIGEEYIDDGFSGTTFNRPGFKQMIKDITNEKINTVIVKDLSRLGRNYIEVGNYLEQVFPLYNIRFIAINDDIDTVKKPNSISNIIVPIKNLMNDEYARDISQKVKSALLSKSKEGKWVGGTAPYGYMKNPENKHQLIINPDEAKIVKTIFRRSLKGDGRIKICKYLNNNFVLCRKEIQRRNKRNLSLSDTTIERRYFWGTTTIGRMLENEAYIENLTYNKTGNFSYKSTRQIKKPRSEWIIVEDTHEAIIDKKTFDKVQKEIVERYHPRSETKNESIYNGILKCNDCNSAMSKQTDNRSGRNYNYYTCLKHRISNDCSMHKFDADELDEIVIKAIRQQVKLVMSLDKAITTLEEDQGQTNSLQSYKTKVSNLEIELEKLKRLKKMAYEDWKFEKISKNIFLENNQDYDNRIDIIVNEIKFFSNKLNNTQNIIKKDEQWINKFRRNKNIRKLTSRTIKELINGIYITNDNNVRIVFNFQDEYKKTIEFLNTIGDKI